MILTDQSFYWSTIAYARWWLGTDASLISMIVSNNGQLNLPAMSSIALPYNVARGLPKRADSAKNCALLSVLNERALEWPSDLVERAEHCAETSETLRKGGCLGKNQVSAITKLMWFMRPYGWTMFDRYAAEGMKIPSHLTSAERMMSFYKALQSSGFDELHQSIDRQVNASEWRSVPSSRIIDTFLMRRGGHVANLYSTSALSAFLRALPEESGSSLHELGNAIQDVSGRNPL